MAAEIYGAVMRCGPRVRGQRYVLSALADIAGAEGIAWPRISTIADSCCMSEKQISRILKQMSQDGWITVLPKQSGAYSQEFAQGKQSVYLIDLGKLGLTPDTAPKLFARQKRTSPDIVSAESAARAVKPSQKADASPRPPVSVSGASLTPAPSSAGGKSADMVSGEKAAARGVTHIESADIPQGVHRTFAEKSPDISDRLSGHLRTDTVGRTGRNRSKATGVEPESTKSTTPTPLARGDESPAWSRFKSALKRQLRHDAPANHPNFTQVRQGENDYDACFRDLVLLDACVDPAEGAVFCVGSDDPTALAAGLAKYTKRVEQLARESFEIPGRVAVTFRVHGPQGERSG